MEQALAVPPDELHVYAASLVDGLLRWDPSDSAQATDKAAKQDFIDALTEISALPSDSLDMEVRRLLVDGLHDNKSAHGGRRHLDNLVSALSQRDVLLKCKAANAVGSLCTSRVAGQQLLDSHGAAILQNIARMATSKNTWAQADAFFVFGWVVVVGEDAVVHQQLVRFIRIAIKLIQKNLLAQNMQQLEEQDANLRVYCLVFLLNLAQRDISALVDDLEKLLAMLHAMVVRLLTDAAKVLTMGDDGDRESEDQADALREHMEFGRLTITLLGTLVDQLEEDAPAMVLSLRMLPDLLKLDQALQSETLRKLLQETQCSRDADEERARDAGSSDAVLADLKERMHMIIETVLAHAHR